MVFVFVNKPIAVLMAGRASPYSTLPTLPGAASGVLAGCSWGVSGGMLCFLFFSVFEVFDASHERGVMTHDSPAKFYSSAYRKYTFFMPPFVLEPVYIF